MITQKEGYILFDIKVVPRSPRNKMEADGENLRLRITPAPVDGKANKAVIDYLSGFLSLPQKSISILRGEASRNKLVRADGITRDKFLTLIQSEK